MVGAGVGAVMVVLGVGVAVAVAMEIEVGVGVVGDAEPVESLKDMLRSLDASASMDDMAGRNTSKEERSKGAKVERIRPQERGTEPTKLGRWSSCG